MVQHTYKNIAEYILQQRALKQLSQEALAIELQQVNELFSDLDGLTISRWERGKVSPNIRRQIAIIEYFGDQPYQLLFNAEFEIKQLASLNNYHNVLNKSLNSNHLLAAHPYVSQQISNISRIGLSVESLPSKLQMLINYQLNLTQTNSFCNAEQLLNILQFPSTKVDFYLSDENLVGHLVAIKVNENTLKAILTGEMLESEITSEDLLTDEQSGCLYVLSIYVGAKYLVNQFLKTVIFYMVENPNNTALGFKAWSDIGLKLSEILDGDVVGLGSLVSDGRKGVKYLGKRYNYTACYISQLDFLANPIMINLSRIE